MRGSRPIFRRNCLLLKIDVSQFSLAISNLLINSIQAVSEKGEIHLFTRGSKKNVFVIIQDNGVGISKEHLPKIFDFMFSTKPTGSGLGLSTAKKIISDHHGEISVKSEVNKGTVFQDSKFRFTPKLNDQGLKRGSDTRWKRELFSSWKMIPPWERASVSFLKKRGYAILLASNGKEGLHLFRQKPVDLVITDLVMPKMDGIELLEAVKNVKPETEVIVISAQGTIEKAVQAMKLGAFDFIEKPINPRVISLVVERALEKQTLVLQNRDLRSKLEDKFHFKNIVGKSEEMVKIFELIHHIAPYDSSVLIIGESGTGKELIANAIHYNSPRATCLLSRSAAPP